MKKYGEQEELLRKTAQKVVKSDLTRFFDMAMCNSRADLQ